MLKTKAQYITKIEGNDCANIRCGSTERKPIERKINQENRGEENRTVPRFAQDSFL